LHAIGSTRRGYSPEEDAAHDLAARWMRAAGLDVSSDAAGNLFRRRGADDSWIGSHLGMTSRCSKSWMPTLARILT
jgi:hypothetical protein